MSTQTQPTLFQRFFTLKRRPPPPPPLATGLHPFMKNNGENYIRYHLRVEPDGSGLLVVNATTAAQLSPVGVVIAQNILSDYDLEETRAEIKARFVGYHKAQFEQDYQRIHQLIQQWQRSDSQREAQAHVTNLQDAAFVPGEVELFAPLEADVPLSSPATLHPLLAQLWKTGIPHVTLLIPPDPNPDDVVRAIERAEDLGMICGVRGLATSFLAPDLVEGMAQAGLDYATLLFLTPDNPVQNRWLSQDYGARFTGLLVRLQKVGIYATAEVPLIAENATNINDIVGYLHISGINDIAFVAYAGPDEMPAAQLDGALTAGALRQVAVSVEEAVENNNVRFHWEPPMERNPQLSLREQIIAGPRTAGDAAVRIAPDGRVFPPRGPHISAGNIFDDKWTDIWNHPAFTNYRERVAAPTHCDLCPGLALCAADCPANMQGWARVNEQ